MAISKAIAIVKVTTIKYVIPISNAVAIIMVIAIRLVWTTTSDRNRKSVRHTINP